MTRCETEMWFLALPTELHWSRRWPQRLSNLTARETLWSTLDWFSARGGRKGGRWRLFLQHGGWKSRLEATGTFSGDVPSELPPVGLFSPGCPGKRGGSWPASAGSCGCLWWPSSAGVLSASSPASARTPHRGTCAAFPVPGPAWCIQWPVGGERPN